MAQISGTTWTNSVAGSLTMAANLREDLEDVIWELDPMDTWALSNLDRVDADREFHEWLSDQLAAPASNIQIEGDDASFATAVPAARLGNYCQIVRKTFLVSGTLEAVKKAGRTSEISRLGTKLLKEMKRDMEQAVERNQASSTGGSGTGRSLASMESWIVTVDNANGTGVRATTTASASTTGFSAGVVGAPTDGTTVGTLTEASLKTALSNAWTAGGDPRVILAAATPKSTYLDTFTGIATRFIDSSPTKQATIIGAANMYVSGFGSPHMIVLSRYMRNSVVLGIDPEYWALSFLRRPFTAPLAITGDGEKRIILSEFTLVCRNPRASTKVVAIQ